MNNQTQYDELWSERDKYRKIVEIAGNNKIKRVSPDEIYEELKEVTVWDFIIEVSELCNTLYKIWEVINNVK